MRPAPELAAHVNAAAVARYHEMFAVSRDAGVVPFVTMNHDTLPLWVHDGVACRADVTGCAASGWVDRDRIVPDLRRLAVAVRVAGVGRLHAVVERGAAVDLVQDHRDARPGRDGEARRVTWNLKSGKYRHTHPGGGVVEGVLQYVRDKDTIAINEVQRGADPAVHRAPCPADPPRRGRADADGWRVEGEPLWIFSDRIRFSAPT